MTHPVSHSEEYQPVFVGKVLDELQAVLKRYPTKQAALLPALWMAQREQGYLDALRETVSHVFVVGSASEAWSARKLTVVADELPGRGALGGIYTAIVRSPTLHWISATASDISAISTVQ